MESLKNIIWQNKLCFKLLRSGHLKRNCKSKNKCCQCTSNSHQTAVCDKNEQNNHGIYQKPKNENEPADDNSVSKNMIYHKKKLFVETVNDMMLTKTSVT